MNKPSKKRTYCENVPVTGVEMKVNLPLKNMYKERFAA